jgi:hypothetical protein
MLRYCQVSAVSFHHVTAPAVLDRLAGIPEQNCGVLDRFNEAHIMASRQLCNNLLHNFWVGGSAEQVRKPKITKVERLVNEQMLAMLEWASDRPDR